jgi:hypothetical protein
LISQLLKFLICLLSGVEKLSFEPVFTVGVMVVNDIVITDVLFKWIAFDMAIYQSVIMTFVTEFVVILIAIRQASL